MTPTKERPYFGNEQIRSSKEINLGDMVIPVYFKCREFTPVEIVGYFTKKLGSKMEKGFLIRESDGKLDKMYYKDRGLLPYNSGWNDSNWLKKANN